MSPRQLLLQDLQQPEAPYGTYEWRHKTDSHKWESFLVVKLPKGIFWVTHPSCAFMTPIVVEHIRGTLRRFTLLERYDTP